MAGVNKVILVGNLGKDPEVRYLDNGVAVANFSLATTENYKNKAGERVSQTEWHNIVLWRGLAEVAEKYLKKGASVYIEGKIKTRKWEDKDELKFWDWIANYYMCNLGDVMNAESKPIRVCSFFNFKISHAKEKRA